MKKIITILFAAILMAAMLSACANTSDSSYSNVQKADGSGGSGNLENSDTSGKISIVTTLFPEYDWVREILGDKTEQAELTILLDNGVDLHSYQPTADDLVKIANCDMFIYVGGESDEWVEDALGQAENKDMAVISLLDVLGDSVKAEETVEGMQEEEHEHSHDGEIPEEEKDEHVWLSLRNAQIFCREIAAKLSGIDAKNKDIYTANADAYIAKLSDLDSKYKTAVSAADKKTLLFGDRFPFRYLVDDYGLDYFAAFAGCSAETEASFETITFLANKVDELELSSVLALEGAEHKIAETIISSTSGKNQKVLTMDSLQSTVLDDAENGTTYLTVMEQNLEVLEEALK